MLKIYATEGKPIPLGRRGEREARQVYFDTSTMRQLYGEGGTFQLLVRRPSESVMYPVVLTQDGSHLVWTVSDADTAILGLDGCVELHYQVGNTLAKPYIWQTQVAYAMGEPTEDPPEAAQAWVDEVLNAAEDAKSAAAKVETATVHQPVISEETSTWWVWDFDKGAYTDTGVSAKGKTPVKGEDYFTAEDKAELVERVIEEMPDASGGIEITNTAAVGQTVKITAIDADGKPTEWEAVDFPAAIVDVVELPTEDIDEDVFYRVVTASFLYGQFIKNDWTMYTVESLPETGEMCWDGTKAVAYYSVSDNATYGYVDANVSAAMGVPVGWYTADVLIPAVGEPYGGIITDISKAADSTVYTLLQNVLHSCKDGVWSKIDPIGWRGTGESAEIFNHLSNVASGSCAHVEGINNSASGDFSHAQGANNSASGDFSHAQGVDNSASGQASHAQGEGTTARGFASYTEGFDTVAASDLQHVQGKRNIEDTAGKYAHIVGNGDDSARSNAHTLSWGGVGWYAGGLKVGGTGQDDENAKSVLLDGDVYSKLEIDAIMGSYINDIAAIVGGDA